MHVISKRLGPLRTFANTRPAKNAPFFDYLGLPVAHLDSFDRTHPDATITVPTPGLVGEDDLICPLLIDHVSVKELVQGLLGDIREFKPVGGDSVAEWCLESSSFGDGVASYNVDGDAVGNTDFKTRSNSPLMK